jgi:hypothetical protein
MIRSTVSLGKPGGFRSQEDWRNIAITIDPYQAQPLLARRNLSNTALPAAAAVRSEATSVTAIVLVTAIASATVTTLCALR